MNWDSAKKACAALGDGWRLPTKQELNVLYVNKEKIGSFTSVYYWSSAENVTVNFIAWTQNFGTGFQDNGNKNDTYYVRAIRDF